MKRVSGDIRGGRPAGFSLGELLVVLSIIAILFAIFVPYLAKSRETARRTRCVDNLRAIQLGLYEYARSNGQDYPRVAADPNATGYAAFTGAGPGTPVQPNDVTASLWLIVRQGLVEPGRFVCPGSDDVPDPLMTQGRHVTPRDRSNFTAGRHLSYGYASPFSRAEKFKLNRDVLPVDFAIMADNGPGPSAADVPADAVWRNPIRLARANSLNHGRAGQNVLDLSGSVAFKETPYSGFGQGWERDNIYTAHAARVPATLPDGARPAPQAQGLYSRDVLPADQWDSYLVPADGE